MSGPIIGGLDLSPTTTGDVAYEVRIVVHGVPASQGSKSGFAVKKNGAYTGKVAMTEQGSKKLKPWRSAVREAALDVMDDSPPLDGPLEAVMVFSFRRPQGHWRTGRNAHLLRDSAPARPSGYPDCSKVLRATEDALTEAGVWADDSRVVEYSRVAKVWAGSDDPLALKLPGAVIIVRQMVF